MIDIRILRQIYILLFLIIAQLYIPSYVISKDIMLFPDLVLIYLVYLSLLYERYYLIIIGFVLGLFQDFVSQSNLIGLFAFSKTIAGFMLGLLSKYDRVWNNKIKLGYLFLTFQIHYIFACYMMFDRSITSLAFTFKSSIFESIFMLILLLVVNRFILIDNKIIK